MTALDGVVISVFGLVLCYVLADLQVASIGYTDHEFFTARRMAFLCNVAVAVALGMLGVLTMSQ